MSQRHFRRAPYTLQRDACGPKWGICSVGGMTKEGLRGKPGAMRLSDVPWEVCGKVLYVTQYLAVLKAKIKIKNPRIRAGIDPKPTISLGKWQSGPSPGTPRAKAKTRGTWPRDLAQT